jgi:hypothetical protein
MSDGPPQRPRKASATGMTMRLILNFEFNHLSSFASISKNGNAVIAISEFRIYNFVTDTHTDPRAGLTRSSDRTIPIHARTLGPACLPERDGRVLVGTVKLRSDAASLGSLRVESSSSQFYRVRVRRPRTRLHAWNLRAVAGRNHRLATHAMASILKRLACLRRSPPQRKRRSSLRIRR